MAKEAKRATIYFDPDLHKALKIKSVETSENKPLKDVFLAFQVIPRLKEGNNFEIVDKAIEVVKAANVPFQVGAMETTMKGDLDQLLEIVKKAQQACYDNGAVEVITNIKIHSKTPEATDTFCTYDRGVTPANHMFVTNKEK